MKALIALLAASLLGVAAVIILQLFPVTPAAAAGSSVTIQNFAYDPASLTVPVGTAVTWTDMDQTVHTASSDTGVWNSGTLSPGGTFSFTFAQPGSYRYHCNFHPDMGGTIVVQAAPSPSPSASGTPSLSGPNDGERISSFGPSLSWSNPSGATQYELQIIPFNNDGPGVDVHVGSAETSFQVPPPPQWYGLLPDITYTWRVRTSNASTFVSLTDASWSNWAERTFKTPQVTSATINSVSPAAGATVTGLTPTLQWSNSRADVYYYEVQVSRDAAFGSGSFLYSELRHGGVTTPPNSYTIPSQFPLQPNTGYSWRVRPRVQGDGKPVDWSDSFRFVAGARAEPPPPGPGPPLPTSTPTPTTTATRTPTATSTPNMGSGNDMGGRDGY